MSEALALGLVLVGEEVKAGAMRIFIIGGVFFGVLMLIAFFVLRANRPKPGALKASLDEEFNRSKDALLLAAQAKKAAKEREQGEKRQLSAEEKEKELLRENVNPDLIIDSNCPICGLNMDADVELIIDPYSGTGCHLSCFLNDWPVDRERPKFIYRYPEAEVRKTSEFIRSM